LKVLVTKRRRCWKRLKLDGEYIYMENVLVFIYDTSSLQRLIWGLYLGAEVVLVISGHYRYVTIEMRFNTAFASHPSPK
jgi:hypothetical protein